MSASTISRGASRAQIMTWRDNATLEAMGSMHFASVAAMQTLEDRLDAIPVTDAITNSDAVARNVVGPAMRTSVGVTADTWFKVHARALRQVDARLETLALHFAEMGQRPPLPQYDMPTLTGWAAPAWLRGSIDTIGLAVDRAATEVANRAVPDVLRSGAERVTARLGRGIGEHSGAYDRLRAAARTELARTWLGPSTDLGLPQPYLTQLLDLVDHTSKRAVETIA